MPAKAERLTGCNSICNDPKKNVCASFFRKNDGSDKVAKLAVAFLRAHDAILDLTDASAELKNGFRNFTTAVEVSRQVFGLPNIVRGVIPGAVGNVRNFVEIVTSGNGDVKSYNTHLKEERTYSGTLEKILAAVSNFGGFVGGVTYIIAFGLMAPIRLFDGLFKNQINKSVSDMGKQFSFMMMINHFGEIVALIANMVRETIVDFKLGNAPQEAVQYAERMAKLIWSFLVKICEIGVDIIKVIGVKAPLGVVLILNIIASGIQVFQVWQDTATEVNK